jgi:hypothetical protein
MLITDRTDKYRARGRLKNASISPSIGDCFPYRYDKTHARDVKPMAIASIDSIRHWQAKCEHRSVEP